MRYFEPNQHCKAAHRLVPAQEYIKSLYLQSDTWVRCQDFLNYWSKKENIPQSKKFNNVVLDIGDAMLNEESTCWAAMQFAVEAFKTQEPHRSLELASRCGALRLSEIAVNTYFPQTLTQEGACFINAMRQVVSLSMGEIFQGQLHTAYVASDYINTSDSFDRTVLYVDPTLDRLCLYAEHATLKLVYVLTSPAEYSDDYFSIYTGHITDDTIISERS